MRAGVIKQELATATPFVDYSGLYDKRHAEAIKGGRTEQQAHDDAILSVRLAANWDCPGKLSDDDIVVLVDWFRMFVRGDDQLFLAWQAIRRCQRGQRQDDEAGAVESGYPFAWQWHPERLGELEAWRRELIENNRDDQALFVAVADALNQKPEAPAKAIKGIKPNTFEPANSVHVVKRCAVIRDAYETGGADHSEPLWFAILRCVAAMEPDISVEVSDGHSKFSLAELGDRMERIESERLKPSTCGYIAELSDLCGQCEWHGLIKSPLALAYDHLPKIKKGVAA